MVFKCDILFTLDGSFELNFFFLNCYNIALTFFLASNDKSFEQWKHIWCWPSAPGDVVYFALWEGEPISVNAAFLQTCSLSAKVQACGIINKLHCMSLYLLV